MKEQKRKKEIARRIKCHGNNNACIREHEARRLFKLRK